MFEIEPQEAVDALKVCLKVCVTFKSTYFDYKARAGTECPSNTWRFQNSALFSRLDAFLERLHDLLDMMQTILQFNKLERVEVGGTKGKQLTQQVKTIYSDFLDYVKVFRLADYEIVDVVRLFLDTCRRARACVCACVCVCVYVCVCVRVR